ncbi:small integral membrane protein 3 isoform X1 [Mus caroli]|nr:small integral membrane protein 3 isoform X1 [Mus caroli]
MLCASPSPDRLSALLCIIQKGLHTLPPYGIPSGHFLRRSNMDAITQSPVDAVLPKHILDIWAIVLIILATIVIMTSLFLCPATAVIIYRMRTHPVLNGAA